MKESGYCGIELIRKLKGVGIVQPESFHNSRLSDLPNK